ncbi:DUF1093 domain-containing protein [Lactobacillus sp. DCY120]|uniref:DUF1093 domain-containing protein n=1 Tax=Bombilactobacillus apium TaxID=2675299 RepID=A0A850QVZ6_9LACO|nr:DUF1093 domain-containing protein [Bombilactobacillus apium]NVY95964.1 DUF1093 domain-containing protein [Bombilactobacillus apium]
MKKLMKYLLGIVIFFLLIFSIMPFFTKNKTGMGAVVADMINPLVRSEVVYGKVPAQASTSWEDQGTKKMRDYGYNVHSYFLKGHQRIIQIPSFGRKLPAQPRFVKVTIKGQRMQRYQLISREQIPAKLRAKIGE